MNSKTLCSSKSCENHDTLSQFCLKESFEWVPEPIWGKFQIPSSGHDRSTPTAHSLPTRPRAAECAGLGQQIPGFGAASWNTEPAFVLRLGFHLIINIVCINIRKRPTFRQWPFLPFPGGGRVYAVGAFFLIPLFCFCKLFPWYHGKDLLISTLWVAVSKVWNNWPDMWSNLSWIHEREGLLNHNWTSVKSWLGRKAQFY